MKLAIVVASVVAALHPACAGAAEPETVVLEPSSPWSVENSGERCRLSREFGARKKVILQIDSYGSPFRQRFFVSGDLIPRTGATSIDLRFGFSPDVAERKTIEGVPVSSRQGPGIIFWAALLPDTFATGSGFAYAAQRQTTERAELDFAMQTTSMTLRFARTPMIRLDTGSMAGPMGDLRKCLDDLVAGWGLDPRQQARLSRPPTLIPGTVAEPEHPYPSTMRNNGQGALVPVRVMIDENGRVTRCVSQNTLNPAFERAACAQLQGTYEPALDAAGKPVASFVQVDSLYYLVGPRHRLDSFGPGL